MSAQPENEPQPGAFERAKEAAKGKVIDFATEKAKRAAEEAPVGGLAKLAEFVRDHTDLQAYWDKVVAEERVDKELGLTEGLYEKGKDFAIRVLAGPLMIPYDIKSSFLMGAILTGVIRTDEATIEHINNSARFNEKAASMFLKGASMIFPELAPVDKAVSVAVTSKEGARALAARVRAEVEKGYQEPDKSLDNFHDEEVETAGIDKAA